MAAAEATQRPELVTRQELSRSGLPTVSGISHERCEQARPRAAGSDAALTPSGVATTLRSSRLKLSFSFSIAFRRAASQAAPSASPPTIAIAASAASSPPVHRQPQAVPRHRIDEAGGVPRQQQPAHSGRRHVHRERTEGLRRRDQPGARESIAQHRVGRHDTRERLVRGRANRARLCVRARRGTRWSGRLASGRCRCSGPAARASLQAPKAPARLRSSRRLPTGAAAADDAPGRAQGQRRVPAIGGNHQRAALDDPAAGRCTDATDTPETPRCPPPSAPTRARPAPPARRPARQPPAAARPDRGVGSIDP